MGIQTRRSRFHLFLRITAHGVALSWFLLSPAWGETFIVSDPRDIEDVALRDREFADWNFGGGIVLEAGYSAGLYEVHHSASLIRFDLSGLSCGVAQSATLRLYKPNCSIQMNPVPIAIHEVSIANAAWREGSSLCEKETGACSWRFRGAGKPWAGRAGCAAPGLDYATPALDIQTAPNNRRAWLEFRIPAALVQRWLDHPESNSGLYIKSGKKGEQWGDYVHFFSSEHASGKGPQLLLEGDPGNLERTEEKVARLKRKHRFPPDEATYDRWLAEADNRYVRWTQDASMTREQGKMIFYYDVTVRGEMLVPNCRVPLTDHILTLDALIREDDEDAVRDILKEVRRRLLYWEYIREANWYDAGPLADVLSPLQLGILWGECIFGKMFEKYGDGSWKRLTEEQLEEGVRETVERTRKRLELTPAQAEVVDPLVAQYERLEHDYVEEFRKDLAQTQELIRRGKDDDEMLDAVKRMHLNHDLFLYYQSTFNTPRWSLFMENARAIPLAKMFLKARRKEYNPERTDRQIRHAKRFRSTDGSVED